MDVAVMSDDAQFAALKAMINPEEARRQEVLSKLSYRERVDEEACALKYGHVQRHLIEQCGISVTTEVALEDYARQMYAPPATHGTCSKDRCTLSWFGDGQRFWSLRHHVWMEASGNVFVCLTSGQAHVCDGLSCPYAQRVGDNATRCCISGKYALTGIVFGFEDNGTSGTGGGIVDDDSQWDFAASGGELAPTSAPRRPRRRRRATARDGGPLRRMSQHHESERWRQLCAYVGEILYGENYQRILVDRCVQLWKTIRTQIIALSRQQGADTALVMSTLHRAATAALGSTQPMVVAHFGSELDRLMEQPDQSALRTWLVDTWRRKRPANLDVLREYFAGAVFAFWGILVRLPASQWRTADAPSSTSTHTLPASLSATALTLLQMLRDGLCYAVVYDAETRLVVPCVRNLNNVSETSARSCAYQKRMGYGVADCTLVDSQGGALFDDLKPTSDGGDGESDNDACGGGRFIASVIRQHGLARLRVRELWLIPAHPALAAMPPDDMAPSLSDIDNPFHNPSSFRCRGELQPAIASLFDMRNTTLPTLTIDDMEQFCLHYVFDVDRLVGQP